MLSFVKPSRSFIFFFNCLLKNRQNLFNTARPFTCCCKMTLCKTPFNLEIRGSDPYKMIILRDKSSRNKKNYEAEIEEDDESDEDDPEYIFKGDEVKTYELQTARVDKVLKACFKVSRKDTEDMFYHTRVRVNGRILKKKSVNVNVGDEIDIIKGFVNDNSKLINVSRIEILNIKEDPENLRYSVKVKKSKSLVIQNYSGSDEWRN